MAVSKFSTNSLKTPLKYSSFLAGNAAVVGTSYESIATTTVGGGGVTEITFSSIPSTYAHLQIRAILRQANGESGQMQFNGDTATNYATHSLSGDGATATGAISTTRTTIPIERLGGLATVANTFTGCIIDILDYKNTTKYKTVRMLSGHDENGSGYVNLESGLWQSTSAITSIRFFTGGNVYGQYTQYALYGIKGA